MKQKGGMSMTDKTELEVALLRANKTKREAAEAIGLTFMGFHKKETNITEFKASEIAGLQKLLCLSNDDVMRIFFARKVELNETEEA